MSWNDDSWRDGYDAWKLASPYDDEDPCDHEEYEADIMTGRATCTMCGYAWWQTTEESAAESRRQAEYGEWAGDQERPWTRFKEWAREWWHRIKLRWPARKSPVVDDLPF